MNDTFDLRTLVNRLNRIGVALSSEHSLGKLLETIVSELRSFTRSDGGSIYTKKGDMLSFDVAQNDTLEKRFGSVPFKSALLPLDTRSIAGYVASTGNLINIADLDAIGDDMPYSLSTMREFDRKMGLKTVSMLAVPMLNHKDEIIGVVQLMNALDDHGLPVPYETWMVEIVSSLASQAAVAICNSILISDIKCLFESLVTYSAQAIDARSPHTAGHSLRVSQLVMRQAETINRATEGPFADVAFSEEQLNELRMAAWLHDIGKIGVREYVLDKVNKLSDDRLLIAARLDILGREMKLRSVEQKFALAGGNSGLPVEMDDIDRKTEDEMRRIDEDIALIRKFNKPGPFTPDEEARLKSLASRTYTDATGAGHPCIEPEELEHLLVGRGNLTEAERREIQGHVQHTLTILEKIPFTPELENIPLFAATHHEMLDGSGYPNKLCEGDIPFQARIITVADIYEALTAKDRPYKPPLPHEKAVAILREEAKRGKLDSDLVEFFIKENIHTAI